jgi:signal transduction histidine kinase
MYTVYGMEGGTTRHRSTHADLATALIRQLGHATKFSNLRDVLRLFLSHFDIYGVVLWELAHGVEPVSARRLFVQGACFRDQSQPAFYAIPMDSISGRAILEGKAVRHSRVESGNWPEPVSHPKALNRLRITSFMTVPLRLHGEARGTYDSALTFYRRSRSISEREFISIKRGAALFPMIYRAILTSVSSNLLMTVQEFLRHAQYPGVATQTEPQALARSALQPVIRAISQSFRNLETVLYLGDQSIDEDRFDQMAAEWSWSREPKQSYRRDEGGTGWVLRTGKPLQILDMARYQDDLLWYEREYPGMSWKDQCGIVQAASQEFPHSRDQDMPPLSYVCVPVLHQNTVLGALRCCIPRQGPYYFDDDLTKTLGAVADLVGDWWTHWLYEQSQDIDNTRLFKLLTTLSQSNREALLQLEHPEKNPAKIIDLALSACQKLTPEVEIFQIWMKRSDEHALELVREWRLGGNGTEAAGEITSLLTGKLLDGRDNALVEAWNGRKTVSSTAGNYALPHLPQCRCFTLAPIMVGDDPHGVLLMANERQPHVKSPVETVARFIAHQLALYETLRRQLVEMDEARRHQDNLLLDFQHQVRSPTNMAFAHAELLLQSPHKASELSGVIMESTRRASSIASNLRLFVELAQENPPAARQEVVRPHEIFQKLQRAARNLYNYKALDKRLEFSVDASWGSQMGQLRLDGERLDLVFDNLLDNAVKYSYTDTRVTVSGGVAADRNEVFFSFRSTGLPISATEAARMATVRGYRGESAKLAHPEGTGVGLWLSQKLLLSMHGRLEILPTDASGANEIRVYLRRA